MYAGECRLYQLDALCRRRGDAGILGSRGRGTLIARRHTRSRRAVARVKRYDEHGEVVIFGASTEDVREWSVG